MSLKIILYRIPLIRRSRIDVTETTSRRVWDRPWIENWVYNCAFGFIDGVVWVYFCSADYCNIRTAVKGVGKVRYSSQLREGDFGFMQTLRVTLERKFLRMGRERFKSVLL